MIVKVKGSHEIFRGINQTVRVLAKERFSQIKSVKDFELELDCEAHQLLSEFSYCATFWIHDVKVPKEHFDIFPEDEVDEELLSDTHEDCYLLEHAIMTFVEDIVERYEEMRCREIDFENRNYRMEA